MRWPFMLVRTHDAQMAKLDERHHANHQQQRSMFEGQMLKVSSVLSHWQQKAGVAKRKSKRASRRGSR